MVSTAGIRGPQNILYPQDTRFPINLVGIVLATLAKALVAKEKYPDKDILIVTHLAPYRALRHLINKTPLKGNLLDGEVRNCQMEEFEI